ncbi:hypothetical protein [Microbispora sp. NPDC049125]|uniref:hypothetical protein n=1 Tax=Microbispora sp. NPDC049125 TaxID=3154929 RepID=UPI0034655091
MWRSREVADYQPGCPVELQVGRLTSTADMVDLIWDDDAPATAVNAIQKYVGALRRLLEDATRPASMEPAVRVHDRRARTGSA